MVEITLNYQLNKISSSQAHKLIANNHTKKIRTRIFMAKFEVVLKLILRDIDQRLLIAINYC